MVISRPVIKNALMAISVGLVTFLVLAFVLMSKSFYPYRMTFYARSPMLYLIDPVKFTPIVKAPVSDEKGGTFQIDAVERIEDVNELRFTGRYYRISAADPQTQDLEKLLTEIMGANVSFYLAEQLCVPVLHESTESFQARLLKVRQAQTSCVNDVNSETKKLFKISSFSLVDDQRIKKIGFLSAVVALFFSALLFVFLEGRRV